MTSLADRIATAVMDTIERERRINKDDLVHAIETEIAASRVALTKTLGFEPERLIEDAMRQRPGKIRIVAKPTE